MKIALLGFGLEAHSAYYFLREKYPSASFEIYDQNESSKLETPQDAEVFLGVNDFSEIQADLLVRTPAVNPKELPFGSNITSVTKLFFDMCPAKIIGVTGSKGKGTTSSFAAEICRAAGIKTHLVGNIGVPALDQLSKIGPDDIVIYELSSFQLWDMDQSPHIAVATNIEADHLDVHDDISDYFNAKMNIFAYQTATDFAVYNQEDSLLNDQIESLKDNLVADLIPFPSQERAHINQEKFFWSDEELFSTDILKLPGKHNQSNALAAITATFPILSNKLDDFSKIKSAWQEGLANFEGLPHRLKFVRKINGVDFYDDSIATTPGSAIAAINAFDQPKILILGGNNKGADLGELIDKISTATPAEIKNVILIGDESSNLQRQLTNSGFRRFINLGSEILMPEIVEVACDLANDGDVVILSPAHASFDMFKSYADRGEQFIQAVQDIAS